MNRKNHATCHGCDREHPIASTLFCGEGLLGYHCTSCVRENKHPNMQYPETWVKHARGQRVCSTPVTPIRQVRYHGPWLPKAKTPSVFAGKSNEDIADMCLLDNSLWLSFGAHIRRYPLRRCDTTTATVILGLFGEQGVSGRHSRLVQWAMTSSFSKGGWYDVWQKYPALRIYLAGFGGNTCIDFASFTQNQLKTMYHSVNGYEHLQGFVCRYIGDQRLDTLAKAA